jgi:hypothetical protein
VSNDKGFFEFNGVETETYQAKISAQGFGDWTSPDLALKPGQYVILTVPRLQIATAFTSVFVGYSAGIARLGLHFRFQKAEERTLICGSRHRN